MPIKKAVTRHGPLASTAADVAAAEFIVVAPQLPTRGDVWYRYRQAVDEIVHQVREVYQVDTERMYLTGFSFGGNGVFDLALKQSEHWAALWPVDPTCVPQEDPGRPVWLSSGQISRGSERAFVEGLKLQRSGEYAGSDRVYLDRGHDHAGTAKHAYQDEAIYRWLLSKQLPE